MPSGIYIRTEAARKKISDYNKSHDIRPPSNLGKHWKIFKEKIRLGEKHHSWKSGLPKCLDCNKKLGAYSATYCNACVKKGEKNPFYGKKMSTEHRKKLSILANKRVGELHQNWKGGISRDKHSLSTPEYKKWRMDVFIRDKFKCRIADINCKGQLQPHHILRWKDYPELRYVVNNSITLCVAHHPRKKKDEAELSPYFQKLVAEVN